MAQFKKNDSALYQFYLKWQDYLVVVDEKVSSVGPDGQGGTGFGPDQNVQRIPDCCKRIGIYRSRLVLKSF